MTSTDSERGSSSEGPRSSRPGPKPDPSKRRSRYRLPVERVYAPKTHCPQGHPYDEVNTYRDPAGNRQCKTCRRDRMAARRVDNVRVGRGHANAEKTHCPHGHEYTEKNTAWSKDGRRRSCRTCARGNSALQTIKQYGLTIDAYNDRLIAQDNCCAICREEFTRTPDIDHEHTCCPGRRSCGECVRGLICHPCNVAIGFFKDDPITIARAVGYLLTTSSSVPPELFQQCADIVQYED